MLARDGPYRVYYGPIGAWPHPQSRIIFVGLTPGIAQLEAAARIFLSSPESVRSNEVAYSERLRTHVVFAGSMRRNLCRMLDDIGLPASLDIERSEQLFSEGRADAAATSALVFPVFESLELRNFSGSRDLAGRPLFREMLAALLLPRLLRAPRALIVPFGLSAESGITYLVREGLIDETRVLRQFPHPSGGNGHRVAFFARDRDQLIAAVAAWRQPAPTDGRTCIDVAFAGDVEALIALDVPLTSEAYQAAVVRESVAAGRCYVARSSRRAVAYVTWDLAFFNRPFVRLLAVGRQHRRLGLGAALIARVEEAAAAYGELFVSTEQINAPMRALLASRGYAPSGSVDNVNAPGNPELFFHKRLDGGTSAAPA